MKIESSVIVPLVEENDLQCECKAEVDSVTVIEVPVVDCIDTMASDRLTPVRDGEPSHEIPTAKSQITALYPIGIRNIVEPSTSESCSRASRPRSKQKLSHVHSKVQRGENSESLGIKSEVSSTTPSHSESTSSGATVESPSPLDLDDHKGIQELTTVFSGSSLLGLSDVEDGKSRKRRRSPSESNGNSSINADSANTREMTRTLPPQTCPMNTSNPNWESDQKELTDESREVESGKSIVEIPSKLLSCDTSSVKLSLPIISLTTLKQSSLNSLNKNTKLTSSCREDISRQPLSLISNINRIRFPKRNGVRVVARKDLSPLGASHHPAARTRFYTPPHRVVGGRKHREYLRLRAMLPAPRRRAAMSKVSVVCEAARHIDQLHGALIRRFRERLPPALAGCGLSSSDVGQRNIRQLVLRVLAACSPGSLPPAPLENARSQQSAPPRPRGGGRRR